MQKFSFRLQSVLDYRGKLVERQRLEVANAQSKVQAERQRLEELRAAWRTAQARLAEEQRDLVDVDRVHQLLDYLAALERRILDQEEVVEQARLAVAEAQQLLLTQSRDQKALEKLREHQSDDYAREVLRVEQIETSELAARRHEQRRSEP
jgi:flagellar protein FliJ